MKYPKFVTLAVGICALTLGGLFIVQARGGLDAGRARDLLRHLGGGELPKQQVRIRSVEPGMSGDEAVVEAQIETAFRFARRGDEWHPVEIRLGDRQWESLELVAEAVRREKNRRTIITLQQLAEGLATWKREHGSWPDAKDIGRLLEQLPPRFVTLRDDLWGSPFEYSVNASGYHLSSRGADRQAGSADDLIIENGTLRTP